jgi:tyrosine-protein phosphatase YwqE
MNDVTFTSYDYAIGGKMVVGTHTMTEMDAIGTLDTIGGKERIKESLIQQMAKYMLENKLAEFTMTEDHARGTRTFRVRAYLAPNDQVKILRTAYKID